jgi:hypothetical protein
MLRSLCPSALPVLFLALVSACGPGGSTTPGTTDTGAGTTGTSAGTTEVAGTSTTAPTTSTDPGTSTTPTTTQEPGTTIAPTTSADPDTFGEDCEPGYSAGCCFGDGECCPCVGFACEPFGDAAAIEAFQQCTCQSEVCADACEVACVGGGIDGSCFVCAEKAARGACEAEFVGCDGALEFACDAPPASCAECEQCSLTGDCFDAWFACWDDEGGCQDIMLQCEPGCRDQACLQQCADDATAGKELYAAFLSCTYCDRCAEACGDVGVTCG